MPPASTDSTIPVTIPVIIIDPEAPPCRREKALELTSSYGYPLVSMSQLPADGYALYFGVSGVELRQLGKGAVGPIRSSFVDGKNAHRRRFGGGKGQMIAKAVGVSSGVTPQVLDATAGLGRDAFVLASLGCTVDMFERVPVVEVLLEDALTRAAKSDEEEVREIVNRMHLRSGDAVEWLRKQTKPVTDVIYLDPMYPIREKSAAVKKEMRVFHSLVGDNFDDAELLEAALEKARYRVVVKRPRKGKAIAGPKPQFQLLGKSSRFDIYTLQSLSLLRQVSCTGGG